MIQKQSTSARQPYPSCAAVEQLDLDLFLELFDLLTERRLRDVETLRGPTEIQLFSDGNEVPQMTQFHADIPSLQTIADRFIRLNASGSDSRQLDRPSFVDLDVRSDWLARRGRKTKPSEVKGVLTSR